MFQTIVIVSVLYTGMQHAGGYPIQSSVENLPNGGEPSYHNVARSMDVVNKAHTTRQENSLKKYSVSPIKTADAITFRDVQKSTVSSAFSLDLKISKCLPSSPMSTKFIAHDKNAASAKLMTADWTNSQHSLGDDGSATHPVPEQTTETTTKSADQLTTTGVVIDNATTILDDTADRTRRVTRHGEADDKRWHSIEVATNADRKSPSPDFMGNLECPCHVNNLQPDIRFPDERDKEVGKKTGDGTDWRNL